MKLLFLCLSILLAPAFSYAAGGDPDDRPSKTRKKRVPYPEEAGAQRDDTGSGEFLGSGIPGGVKAASDDINAEEAAKAGGATHLPPLEAAAVETILPGITGRTRSRQRQLRGSKEGSVTVALPHVTPRSHRRRKATPSLKSQNFIVVHPIVLSSLGISAEVESIMRGWFPDIIIENGIGYLPKSRHH